MFIQFITFTVAIGDRASGNSQQCE